MPLFIVDRTTTETQQLVVMAPDAASAEKFETRQGRVLQRGRIAAATVACTATPAPPITAIALPTGAGKFWAGSSYGITESTRVLEYTEFDDPEAAVIRAEMILGTVPESEVLN